MNKKNPEFVSIKCFLPSLYQVGCTAKQDVGKYFPLNLRHNTSKGLLLPYYNEY